MRTYRVKIRFTSDSGTPLHSDTMFGHLCWVYRYYNGEEALEKDILEGYDTQPAVLVSDGFPSGFFPYPCLPPVSEEAGVSLFKEFFPSGRKEDFLSFIGLMKRIRKTRWIEDVELEEIVDNLTSTALARSLLCGEIKKGGKIKPGEVPKEESLVPHNTINRLTGTVEREGGGFFHSFEGNTLGLLFDIYVRTSLNWSEKEVGILFSQIGNWGYGKDRSTGKGQFLVEDVVECSLPDQGNAVISLSHFVPEENLCDGYYLIETKFGKLGGHYSQGSVPFPKTPLIMLKPGAVLKINQPKAYYGQSVGVIHPDLRGVRQQTYLFPYFVTLGVEK